MIYCDGTEYQGSLDDPVDVEGRMIYFRGMDNMVQAF
jgi:hypothetical protein